MTISEANKIFLVDDQQINLQLLNIVLRDQGFELLSATSGEEAIAEIQETMPDLILLDIMMPGIDGFETCNQLKSIPTVKDIPIIFMSALTQAKDIVKGFELGGVDYITKPFEAKEVLVRINNQIKIRRLNQELNKQNEILKQEIEQRKKVEEKLNILFQASQQSPASIVITNIEGNITYVNPKFEELSGYSQEEVLGKNPRILKSNETDAKTYQKLWRDILAGKEWHGEFTNLKKNGEKYLEKASISPIFNSEKQITHFVAVKEDITLKKYHEKLLEYRANYDLLTDIPNRHFALERLQYFIDKTVNHQTKIGLMFIDLDRFKEVNDIFGHALGDELLKVVSYRIKNILRNTDMIARLGGDEFLIIIPSVKDSNILENIAQKIIEVLQQPFNFDKIQLNISGSVGITIYPDDALEVKNLMNNADTAMYHAKEEGKNNFQRFNKAMKDAITKKRELQTELKKAIKNQQFLLAYQPIIDLKTKKIVSAESLIRWPNKKLGNPNGFVSPERFIPVAEENGSIIQLGQWILKEACQEAVKWQRDFYLPVTVNISPLQFTNQNFIHEISNILEDTKLKSNCLSLEITESLLLEKICNIETIFAQLNEMNISLSLDDFGTGYSSLNYLTQYPFKILKIDKSFINKIVDNHQVFVLVEIIINMAKSLNLKIVAEGIETKAQLDLITSLGCDFGQGYLFSKPLYSEDFINFIQQENYNF